MAYQVRLLFPVDVEIEPVDKAATKYDSSAREPVLQVARGTTVTLPAQVEWTERNRPNPTRAGTQHKSRGYLVLLTRTLPTYSYTPKRGDKIVSIPNRPGKYFVTSITPHAHRNGVPQTLHLEFADRSPTQGVR